MKNAAFPWYSLALLWLCAGFALPALAVSPPKVLAFPLEPFSYEDQGQVSGYAVELFVKMSKEAGLEFPRPEVQPLMRVAKAAETGNTLVVALGRTEAREAQYQWVAEIFVDSFSFANLPSTPPINSFDEARKVGRILVNRDGAPETILRSKGFSDLEVSTSDNSRLLRMLLAGRGKTWFGSTTVLKTAIRDYPQTIEIQAGKPVMPISLWIAGSKDLPPELIQRLQAALKKLKSNGEYDRIFAPLK